MPALIQAGLLACIFMLVGAATVAIVCRREDDEIAPWLWAPIGASVMTLSGVLLAALGVLSAGWFLGLLGVAFAACIVRYRALARLLAGYGPVHWLAAGGVVLLALVLLLEATPLWYFQFAPKTDAGNYELYANWIVSTGGYVRDMRGLVAAGAPPAWLSYENTWFVDAAEGIGLPAYVYGYPTLAAIAKVLFGSSAASGVLNPVLFALLLPVAYGLLRREGLGVWTAVVVVAALSLSPMCLYYSKQYMSEMLALLAAVALFAGFHMRGAGRALCFVLFSALLLAVKIDSLFFVLVLAVAVALCMQERPAAPGAPVPSDLPWLGLGGALGAVGTACIVRTGYLAYVSPPQLDPPLFIGGLGIALLAGYLMLRWQVRATPPSLVPHLRRMASVLMRAAALVLLGIFLWSASLRPIGIDPAADSDAFNVLRLLPSSPLLPLLLLVVAAPFLFERASPLARLLLFVSAAWLSLLLVDSSHSGLELWWMRRFLVPLWLGAFGALLSLMPILGDALQRATLSALLLLGLAIQWPLAWGMVDQTNNPDSLAVVERVAAAIDGQDALVVLDGSAPYAGTLNTVSSLSPRPTLFNVPVAGLERALALLPDAACIAIASNEPLEDGRLTLLADDDALVQWATWYAEVLDRATPPRLRTSGIHLYSTCSAVHSGMPSGAGATPPQTRDGH